MRNPRVRSGSWATGENVAVSVYKADQPAKISELMAVIARSDR
jgi:hypothetical protein